MDVWGWISVAFALAALAVFIWALFHQARQFPRERVRVGDPDEPRGRDIIKWYGSIFGGGRG